MTARWPIFDFFVQSRKKRGTPNTTGDPYFEGLVIIPGMPKISLVGARDVNCCYCCCDCVIILSYPSWRITFTRRCVSAKLNLTSNRDLVKNAKERIIYFERIAAVWRDRTALTFKNGRTAVALHTSCYYYKFISRHNNKILELNAQVPN